MGEAVQNDPGYPSLITIVNLWRTLVNDPKGEIIQTPLVDSSGTIVTVSVSFTTDPVQGRIVSGEPTICAPILMSSVREVCRELRLVSSQTLIRDNVIFTGLPPMASPSFGAATSDPAVQVNLNFVGFNNGAQSYGNFLLPADCLAITHVWERLNNSGKSFESLNQASNGLSGTAQSAFSNGSWEQRQDGLWMNGCLQSTDIRLRYWARPDAQYSTTTDYTQTLVPVLDCEEAVAYKCIYKYNMQQGSGSPESMQLLQMSKKDATDAMDALRMQYVRRMQGNSYNRKAYGGSSDSEDFGQ